MSNADKPAPGDATCPASDPTAVRQILGELDVAALTVRISDPERTRVVVVITTGNRAPADRLDARRIAAEAGPDIEVVALPTGSLTYALERGLPSDTNVFGDAARTYPVGTAWHTRPHLSALRFCRADSDARLIESQVIADARAAARHATDALTTPTHAKPSPGSVSVRPVTTVRGVTPATMLKGSARRLDANAPTVLSTAPPSVPTSEPTTPATHGSPAAAARPSGPTPTNPRGAPPASAKASEAARPPAPAPSSARVASAPRDPKRLSDAGPWHARSTAQGQVLAEHLKATRAHPVLVVTTPGEDTPALVDAEDLYRRVGEIADVVVLHTGPASWAMAHAMPPMTEVYGGAGRVYPIDLGWLANPYRAPIRFCWPRDNPQEVADQLEDDAYAAANLAGLTATRSVTATLPTTGEVKGSLGRHHILLRLDRGGEAALLADQLYPGVEPERLLRPGQILTGRVEPGRMLTPFLPDPITDDPRTRAATAYSVGDIVLARAIQLGAHGGGALLHPRVPVAIHADDDVDLRNLIAVDDVVALTLTNVDPRRFTAELAEADAPSISCLPVLPGGPPWLTEQDLPTPEPEPLPDAQPQPIPPTTPAAAAGPGRSTHVSDEQGFKLAALQGQVESLTMLLDRARAEIDAQARKASQARDQAQQLRRENKSLKAQHQAYRDRIEGNTLFSDPEQQLRYDLQQTWLRRTPEQERPTRPLANYTLGPAFLASLSTLEGIAADKVHDVLVEVLTDRAKDIPGRELHQLRESESSQVQRRRADGAKAWRCALQVNTPAARRLHYWKLPNGTVELDRVGTHDNGL